VVPSRPSRGLATHRFLPTPVSGGVEGGAITCLAFPSPRCVVLLLSFPSPPTAQGNEGGMQPLRHGPMAGWGGVAGAGPTTVDEASMERSKSFINALQVRSLPVPRSPRLPAHTDTHARKKKGMIFVRSSEDPPGLWSPGCSFCALDLRCLSAGTQEPAAAALLRLRVLREVLPPQRAEADVSHIPTTALPSSGHPTAMQSSCLGCSPPRTIAILHAI
jgi:hypothetical protein